MAYNTLDWLLALVPLALVLYLMVGLHWNASRAGFAGLALVIALAVLHFGADARVIGCAQVKALILAVDVSVIIWAALVLYYVVDRAGALAVIAGALASLTTDTLVQVLLLAWVFASFLQGVGGFGVPVAITAPLLIGLGISQSRAVLAPALGHGWAVTYGSLATSFMMLQRATEISGNRLAPPAALMLGVLGYLSGFMVAHVLDGWRGVRRSWRYVLVVGTAMSGAQLLLAVVGLWSLGAIGGGLAGLVVSVVWIRITARQGLPLSPQPPFPAGGARGSQPPAVESEPPLRERGGDTGHSLEGRGKHVGAYGNTPARTDTVQVHVDSLQEGFGNPPLQEQIRPTLSVRLALAGYIILVVLALGLRGIAPVKSFLNDQLALRVDIPATTTDRDWTVAAEDDEGFGIPAHPGLVIFYACGIAFLLYRRAGLYAPGAAREIVRQSGRRAFKSALGVYAMIAVAATMARAGMIEILADGMSDAVPGDLYAFVAPLIGALGAFVTGSNVNSNAVFGMLQRNTAELLGLPVLTILAAQTAAAAVISVMSPAKVTVGCSTVGANEGDVLRRLLGYGVVVVLVVGVMAWIGVQIG